MSERLSLSLVAWTVNAQLRAQPGRLALATVSIAIGVALALAIHLVNRSALDAFDTALAAINGEAQLRVESPTGSFDESAWPIVARDSRFDAASPVIDSTFRVVGESDANDQAAALRLRVIGIDPMRAARVTPELLPTADESQRDRGAASTLFADDAIFLSAQALAISGKRVGDPIVLAAGTDRVRLRIAGTVERVPADTALAVMDIGTMQWRLGWIGRISRIDLRLAPGVEAATVRGQVLPHTTPPLSFTAPHNERERTSNLSRAYRVNLNVLALVALFTGVFIVHAAMRLAVQRQQRDMALLGVLGASRELVFAQALSLALVVGIAGAMAGVAAGVFGAHLLLSKVGGDLGAGLFSTSSPALSIAPGQLLLFALAGVATAAAGGLAPAWHVASRPPLQSMRGDEVQPGAARIAWQVPLVLTLLAAALVALPSLSGLPIGSYIGIAAWLLAGILCLPAGIATAARSLQSDRLSALGAPAWLALQRVAANPAGTGAALGGIVASVALAAAMAIMVTSFRTSVADWLDRVLPADLYAQVDAASSLQTALDATAQARIAALPGVARAEFQQASRIALSPERTPIVVLAREVDPARPQDRLPLTGAAQKAPPDAIPLWVSEALVDLYGWAPGKLVSLPIGEHATRFFVAGVWRDYARQSGAVVLPLADWRRLSGDDTVTDVSLWLAPGARTEDVVARLREALPQLAGLRLRSAADIRRISLEVFDRSFALTWALEAVAIAVALFGAAAIWASEALARIREFGTLRHLGMTPGALVRQFSLEAATLATVAVLWGLVLGAAIAAVLVFRVNPQSFHWTMDMAWPVGELATAGAALIVLATLSASLAARRAGSPEALRAVREDW